MEAVDLTEQTPVWEDSQVQPAHQHQKNAKPITKDQLGASWYTRGDKKSIKTLTEMPSQSTAGKRVSKTQKEKLLVSLRAEIKSMIQQQDKAKRFNPLKKLFTTVEKAYENLAESLQILQIRSLREVFEMDCGYFVDTTSGFLVKDNKVIKAKVMNMETLTEAKDSGEAGEGVDLGGGEGQMVAEEDGNDFLIREIDQKINEIEEEEKEARKKKKRRRKTGGF